MMLYGLIDQKVNSVQGSGEDWAAIHQQLGLGPHPPEFMADPRYAEGPWAER